MFYISPKKRIPAGTFTLPGGGTTTCPQGGKCPYEVPNPGYVDVGDNTGKTTDKTGTGMDIKQPTISVWATFAPGLAIALVLLVVFLASRKQQ